MNRTFILLFPLLAASAVAHEPEVHLPFDRIHSHDSFEGHIHSGWESRYFSEGRDSLDGDSLWATSLEIGWNHLSGGIWYGLSPEQNYDEIQLSFALTESVGDFEFYAGFTHIRLPFADLDDNEVGLGGSWSGLPLDIALSADGYHSFDADGSFWELALNRAFEVSDALSLTGAAVFGMNQGYVSDGHNGANNFALRLEAEYALTQWLAVTTHVAYSWALERDSALPGDEQLIDFFHGGLGLQLSF